MEGVVGTGCVCIRAAILMLRKRRNEDLNTVSKVLAWTSVAWIQKDVYVG